MKGGSNQIYTAAAKRACLNCHNFSLALSKCVKMAYERRGSPQDLFVRKESFNWIRKKGKLKDSCD